MPRIAAVHCSWAQLMWRVGVPFLFDLMSHPPPLAWQRPSSPVNKHMDCQCVKIVWRWTCSTHGLCGCGGGVVECYQRHCWCWPGCAVLLGLFVDFRWSVNISWRMGLFEEQDGAVVGVFWPLPSSPASEYIKYTLPALAAKLLQQTWLNESGWVSFTSSMSFMRFTRSFVFLHPSC